MVRLVELVYLMLPAYLANMAPPFVRFWRGWNRPINSRWLGDQWLTVGIGFGVGAMGGDCIKSLFKRARGIAPGRTWIPMDQLDFVIGALIVVFPWVHWRWSDAAIILIVSFLGDIAVNQLAFRMHIRSTPW